MKSLIMAIIFMFFVVSFIRLYGCGIIPVINPVNITRALSCPIADDLTCQKCHTWKKTITDWHNPETGKGGKIEVILPEEVDIDFNTGQTVIINPKALAKDWVCENIFHKLDESLYTVQILYNQWSLSYLPPMPPLALSSIVYPLPNGNVSKISKYWIYKNRVPIEVEQLEWDLFVQALKNGEKI